MIREYLYSVFVSGKKKGTLSFSCSDATMNKIRARHKEEKEAGEKSLLVKCISC